MFSWLKQLWLAAVNRKKTEDAWAANFTNPPADSRNALPLEPESDPWKK